MKILIFVIFSESSLVTEFHGNSSHTDHFKLLKEDGTSVLVGARNIIYNLSLPDLQEYTDQVRRGQRSYYSCKRSISFHNHGEGFSAFSAVTFKTLC